MIHKIAIVGPEASGKSHLTEQLALHFQEPVVTEFAREYLEKYGPSYRQADLNFFAKKQTEKENLLLKKANRFLFCDTNSLSIKVWSIYKYGSSSNQIQDLINNSDYDLSLLLYPDLPYQEDPLREDSPIKNRLELFYLFESELKKENKSYSIISGLDNTRLEIAIKALQSNFSF